MSSILRLTAADDIAPVIIMLHRIAQKQPKDGAWRTFDDVIEYKGHRYALNVEYVLRDDFFSYRNLQISRLDREIITLN